MINMNTPNFNSSFASLLYEFVDFKRMSGFTYNGEVKELQRLDKYLSSNNITVFNDSDDLNEWLQKRSTESSKTFSSRNSIYRQLYKYVTTFDKCTIPKPTYTKYKFKSTNFVPFIFNHVQIKDFFIAIEEDNSTNPAFHRCSPLLFRILYSTGVRINEILSLTVSDVSQNCDIFIVKNGKNDNTRLIPLSSSIQKRLKTYIVAMDYSSEQPLFQSSRNTMLCDSTVYAWFRRILFKAGIPHHGRGRGPRLHDFRHTFAVHSLQKAIESGIDINAFLPILCTYLGHKKLSATERYLRLTSEIFPSIIESSDMIMNMVIPEVKCNED